MVLKFSKYFSYIKMKQSGPSSRSLHEKKCILLSVMWTFLCVTLNLSIAQLFRPILRRCSKCGVDNQSYRWRFMLSLLVSDSSGYLWITSFQESSQSILGVSADTLGEWQVLPGISVLSAGRCLKVNLCRPPN